jgi:hypothetical protein
LFLIVVSRVAAPFAAVAAWFKTLLNFVWKTSPCDNNSVSSGDERRSGSG